jgi:hypothetical protein
MDEMKQVLMRGALCVCPLCHEAFSLRDASLSVNCERCGKGHEIDSDTYVTVYGDIHIGHTGGIVGHNFGFKSDPTKKDGPPTQLSRAMVYCRRPCFVELAIDIADRE